MYAALTGADDDASFNPTRVRLKPHPVLTAVHHATLQPHEGTSETMPSSGDIRDVTAVFISFFPSTLNTLSNPGGSTETTIQCPL